MSGVPQATRPAVAAVDSWKPTSATVAGSTSSIKAAAQASDTVTRDARPLSTAVTATPAMSAARRTDADAPANSV